MGIIKIILDTISPHLRNLIIDFIKSLKVEAEKTPNPWDDIFVSILITLFDIRE